MITKKFKFGKQEVTMYLGYRFAYNKLSDLGIDVFKVLEDGTTIANIMVNDALMIKVWFHYLSEALHAGELSSEYADDFQNLNTDKCLDELDTMPGGLEPFKKAFWDMVVGFSPAQVRPTLQLQWDKVRKQLLDPEKLSTSSTSEPSELSS